MKYYRLFDEQTKDYMHTGYNSQSLLELTEAYISYKSVDTDEDSLWENICYQGIEKTLNDDEFTLEESDTIFEEI